MLLLLPLISTLIMVIWNICFDPVMSTAEGDWIWPEGGAYHGVPLSNFLGWFITVFLVFQMFSLFLLKSGDYVKVPIRHSHWYFFPLMYIVQGVPYVLNPFFRSGHSEIYWTTALLTLLTMFTVAAVNLVVIKKHKNKYE